MQKTRKWLNSWQGALMGVTAGLLLLAAVTVGHAATKAKTGQPVAEPAQGQLLCPATPGAAPCKIILDCPSIKSPGKTVCKAVIDCPGPKTTKPQKKTESKSKSK